MVNLVKAPSSVDTVPVRPELPTSLKKKNKKKKKKGYQPHWVFS